MKSFEFCDDERNTIEKKKISFESPYIRNVLKGKIVTEIWWQNSTIFFDIFHYIKLLTENFYDRFIPHSIHPKTHITFPTLQYDVKTNDPVHKLYKSFKGPKN